MSAGTSVAIGVGSALGVLLFGGLLGWYISRRRRSAGMSWERQREVVGSPGKDQSAENDSTGVSLRYDGDYRKTLPGGRITTVPNSQNLQSGTLDGSNSDSKE